MTRALALALLLALAGCAHRANRACDGTANSACRCAKVEGGRCEPPDQCLEDPDATEFIYSDVD